MLHKILFVCHGNICRSPMAEFILKSMTDNKFIIDSAATSTEEIGNPMYPNAKTKLKEKGIPIDEDKRARQITKEDYYQFDMIIAMDKMNLRNIYHVIGTDSLKKVSLIMDYTNHPGDVSDPWYTGNFEKTYQDIIEGCRGLITYIYNKSANS